MAELASGWIVNRQGRLIGRRTSRMVGLPRPDFPQARHRVHRVLRSRGSTLSQGWCGWRGYPDGRTVAAPVDAVAKKAGASRLRPVAFEWQTLY
jgi:hypothetical protein